MSAARTPLLVVAIVGACVAIAFATKSCTTGVSPGGAGERGEATSPPEAADADARRGPGRGPSPGGNTGARGPRARAQVPERVPDPAITGRVVDASGKPAGKVEVTAFRITREPYDGRMGLYPPGPFPAPVELEPGQRIDAQTAQVVISEPDGSFRIPGMGEEPIILTATIGSNPSGMTVVRDANRHDLELRLGTSVGHTLPRRTK